MKFLLIITPSCVFCDDVPTNHVVSKIHTFSWICQRCQKVMLTPAAASDPSVTEAYKPTSEIGRIDPQGLGRERGSPARGQGELGGSRESRKAPQFFNPAFFDGCGGCAGKDARRPPHEAGKDRAGPPAGERGEGPLQCSPSAEARLGRAAAKGPARDGSARYRCDVLRSPESARAVRMGRE